MPTLTAIIRETSTLSFNHLPAPARCTGNRAPSARSPKSIWLSFKRKGKIMLGCHDCQGKHLPAFLETADGHTT
jgi:hypothetical protein